MQNPNNIDDPRREFLVKALAAGLYSAGVGLPSLAVADFFGRKPEKLKAGQSFYKIEGKVLVNGKPANMNTVVTANDKLETAKGSNAIFVVGKDAFLLKEKSQLKLSGKAKFKKRLAAKGKNTKDKSESNIGEQLQDSALVNSMRLVKGGVLTVFGKSEHEVSTPTASIGIRGTGVYFESEPERSYVCTCYGVTELSANNDADSTETIQSKHHDAPRYILKEGQPGQRIIPAPFKNHSDLELMLLEELVGRTPPFAVSGDNYSAPRRGY